MESIGLLLAVFLLAFGATSAQQNAGSSVAPSLQECYNSTELFDTDRRLPSTINVLIDLIRRAEDGRATQDARQLAIELIHRFRQDGILRTGSNVNSQFTLPFSPSGRQAYKNRVLLRSLIPGTAIQFPNATLNALERCSLHFMMSSSVDTTTRGDEANVCNRLGRYERRTRSISDDVEVFKHDPAYQEILGNMEEEPATEEPVAENPENVEDGAEAEDEEIAAEEEGTPEDAVEPIPDDPALRNADAINNQNNLSLCPVESGVIYTRWGAVQAGTVIAGIAAGLEPQSILQDGFIIDNRFAATLSGDLAEAALWQTGTQGNVMRVGASGGWNSTQVPRWYFISENVNFEMTDADIRGGLDGLILAQNVAAWRNSFNTLRLSQILDMYYSPRGVFNNQFRACNRNIMLNTVAPTETLNAQTSAFSVLLDKRATLPVTIIDSAIPTLSNSIVTRFFQYVPESLSDLSCLADTTSRNRIATDIIIVLDTQWPHGVAHAAISYLLDNLDVNRFGSNFTVINGNDGRIIVNTTNSILAYHQQFNLTVQQQHPTGFQYSRVYLEVENIVRNRMDADRATSNVGGKSTIALFMPFTSVPTEADRVYAIERLEIYRSFMPDLRILILGNGNRDLYNDFVATPTHDIFTLSNNIDGTNIVSSVNPLQARIRDVHRSLVNPACGSDFEPGQQSTHVMEDFLEPQTVNYYRISPNYFRGEGDRALRIRGFGYGNFMVCTSRVEMYVNQNSTVEDRDCRQISSAEETFLMTGFCNDGLIHQCQPFYISAESTAVNTNYRCNDAGCRFPDNIRFTITLENHVCASSAFKLFSSFTLIAVMLAILKF